MGVTEVGGNNLGAIVEKFQKVVDNRAQAEPWCCAFVQFCLQQVDALGDRVFEWPDSHKIWKSEHCLTMWNRSPDGCKSGEPKPGSVVVWERFRDGQPGTGHTGIVMSYDPVNKVMYTVEGNVNGPGGGLDGVYLRERPLRLEVGGFRLKGFLEPWP